MLKEKILERNVLAVNTFFNAIYSIYEYNRGHEITAHKMREVCKQIGMSNMMPYHLANHGVLKKEYRTKNGRRCAVFHLVANKMSAEQIDAIALEKYNYVPSKTALRKEKLRLKSLSLPEPVTQEIPFVEIKKRNYTISDLANALIETLKLFTNEN
jgi:hypothetical protein